MIRCQAFLGSETVQFYGSLCSSCFFPSFFPPSILHPSLPSLLSSFLVPTTYWCFMPLYFIYDIPSIDSSPLWSTYLSFRTISKYYVFCTAFLLPPPHHHMRVIFSFVSLRVIIWVLLSSHNTVCVCLHASFPTLTQRLECHLLPRAIKIFSG